MGGAVLVRTDTLSRGSRIFLFAFATLDFIPGIPPDYFTPNRQLAASDHMAWIVKPIEYIVCSLLVGIVLCIMCLCALCFVLSWMLDEIEGRIL